MRYFLEISYKGTNYFGFQVQPNRPTIQGELEAVLSKVLNRKTGIVGAGRTDSGVHCVQSYVHFDAKEKVPENLPYRLNKMLSPDIVIKRMIPVNEKAHARYDAERRGYRYYLHFFKDPFLEDRSYFYPYARPVIESMKKAAALFPNYEDYKILSKDDPETRSTICHIYKSKLETINHGQQLVFYVEANRFLYNMVRRMVGALLLVGTDKLKVEHLEHCLAENEDLPKTAMVPPQGLILSKVEYPYIKTKRSI